MASLRSALGTAAALVAFFLAQPATAIDQTQSFCADFNTGSGYETDVSIYQTNGACNDLCRDKYAYSVVQWQSCWCTNYAPDKTVDIKECNTKCPAWSEYCGGKKVFGYTELKVKKPSGTKGSGDAPATSSDAVSSSKTSSTSSTTEEPSSTEPSKHKSTTEMHSIITSDGSVRTVTVVPTTDPTNSADGENSNNAGKKAGGGGIGGGAIAGIVIGVLAAIGIIAGALFFFLRRRKQNRDDGYQDDPSVRGNSSDRVGSAHPEMSMGGGTSPTGNSNRNSTLAIDPRMDPFKQGLYMRNNSQESIDTIRDDHDYSRRIQNPKVLRATNPDPDNAD